MTPGRRRSRFLAAQVSDQVGRARELRRNCHEAAGIAEERCWAGAKQSEAPVYAFLGWVGEVLVRASAENE